MSQTNTLTFWVFGHTKVWLQKTDSVEIPTEALHPGSCAWSKFTHSLER